MVFLKEKWWKEAVVYQIYPRSFYDSNNDGIGDIEGIIQKLDYVKSIGVDVIWLCPVYESPNADNGYDISDYRNIAADFGTMNDWEKLLQEIHNRGMRLIMDLVVNHTSDEHQWFIESRSGRENPYRDYYIWRKGNGKMPPNNWVSFFSGSVWNYDTETDEYYLHLFSPKQPDLNWENKKVRKSVYDMMNWWLDKGIDGFRMDVINLISKADGLPSVGDPAKLEWGGQYFMNGPKIHTYLKEMNREALAGRDILTVGEMPGATVEEARRYTSDEEKELNMVFQFELMDCESYQGGTNPKWSLPNFKQIITKWQTGLEDCGWNSIYLNNHDQPRMVSRFGNDSSYWEKSAKMLATLLYTLSGTPYLYQGEEIGMTNVSFPSIVYYNDIDMRNHYYADVDAGRDPLEALDYYRIKSRDNARTPMQWNSECNGGFSKQKPWLQTNPSYKKINVASQISDPNSILNYYKAMIKLRKNNKVLVYGSFEILLPEDDSLFVYIRSMNDVRMMTVLNYSDHMEILPTAYYDGFNKVVISNCGRTSFDGKLSPFEALVLEAK